MSAAVSWRDSTWADEPLGFDTLDALTGGQLGRFDVPCPLCGPDRHSAASRRALKLRVWRNAEDFMTYTCARWGVSGSARTEMRGDGAKAGPDQAHVTPTQWPPGVAARSETALALWCEAHHPISTPVEAYLARRGLHPGEAAGEAIRWHPSCPFGQGVRTGCMIALVRDIRTDVPMAIHRTALTPEGRKAEFNGMSRRSLGPIAGGAAKLTPCADVTLGLGVGEGIETTMSLRHLPGCEALSIWALLAANQLSRFQVLQGLDGLWIAVDHDPTGIAAALAARRRWQAAGVDVITVRPRHTGADLNDILRMHDVA